MSDTIYSIEKDKDSKVMVNRWDETWHRLREWTNSQACSERLAAQILLHEGYENLDPSHPLGGRDGTIDASCVKNNQQWIMAVYFPRGQKNFKEIKNKFLNDLERVKKNNVNALAFVTNQEFRLAERKKLCEIAGNINVELFHLERITAIFDRPEMKSARKQFLGIDFRDTSSIQTVTVNNQLVPQTQETFSNGILIRTSSEIRTIYKFDPFTETLIPLGSELTY